MAVKRVRAAVTGLQDERNRLGWRPVASALENGRWRLLVLSLFNSGEKLS
jgi:hypothetical protein